MANPYSNIFRLKDRVSPEDGGRLDPENPHGDVLRLDGNSNRFVVQYAVRDTVTMTPERRAEWIEELLALRIVNLPSRR